MSDPFPVLAGMLFCLFSKKAFCTWGIFSFLLWEVASSFTKNIPHLLFKQGALEELWSLKGDGMLRNPLFRALMQAGVLAVCRQKSQSLPGLGPGVGCGWQRLPGKQGPGSFKALNQSMLTGRGLRHSATGSIRQLSGA